MNTTVHKKGELTIAVDPTIPDYNRSPFALKKAARARAFIQKNGLPKKEEGKKGK